jgi:hypothetical protein
MTNRYTFGRRLAQVGLPRELASKPFRLILQRPDVWEEMLRRNG